MLLKLESIGSRDFRQIASSILNKGKSSIQRTGGVVLCILKAKLFAKSFSKS